MSKFARVVRELGQAFADGWRRGAPIAMIAIAAVMVGTALVTTFGRPLVDDVAPGITRPSLPACPHEDALPPGATACVWDASEQGNQSGTDVVLVVHPHDPVLPPVSVLVRDPAYTPEPRSTSGAVSPSPMIEIAGLGSGPVGPLEPATLAPSTPPVGEIAGAGVALIAAGAVALVATRRRGQDGPDETPDAPESGPEWAQPAALDVPPSPLAEHVRLSNRRALARAMGDHRQLSARSTADGRRVVVECACGMLYSSTSPRAAIVAHEAHARVESARHRAGVAATVR